MGDMGGKGDKGDIGDKGDNTILQYFLHMYACTKEDSVMKSLQLYVNFSMHT